MFKTVQYQIKNVRQECLIKIYCKVINMCISLICLQIRETKYDIGIPGCWFQKLPHKVSKAENLYGNEMFTLNQFRSAFLIKQIPQ